MKFTRKLSRFERTSSQTCSRSVGRFGVSLIRPNQYRVSKLTEWLVLKNKWFNIMFYNGKNVKSKNLVILFV